MLISHIWKQKNPVISTQKNRVRSQAVTIQYARVTSTYSYARTAMKTGYAVTETKRLVTLA